MVKPLFFTVNIGKKTLFWQVLRGGGLSIWRFPKMVPPNGWFMRGNPVKMDD